MGESRFKNSGIAILAGFGQVVALFVSAGITGIIASALYAVGLGFFGFIVLLLFGLEVIAVVLAVIATLAIAVINLIRPSTLGE